MCSYCVKPWAVYLYYNFKKVCIKTIYISLPLNEKEGLLFSFLKNAKGQRIPWVEEEEVAERPSLASLPLGKVPLLWGGTADGYQDVCVTITAGPE